MIEIAVEEYKAQQDVSECQRAVQRILESRTFIRAPRLASLLEFIVDHSLKGDPEDLTEQQIGIHFFHRPPGYNAGEDTIVRSTARHLRKRLEQYYEKEGKEEVLRINVPKGGYFAYFEMVDAFAHPAVSLPYSLTETGDHQAPAVAPTETFNDIESPNRKASPIMRWMFSIALIAVIFGAGLTLGLRFRSKNAVVSSNDTPVLLWRALFSPNRKTFLVPGDAALNMYSDIARQDVPLREYTVQAYQADAKTPIAGRSRVSMLGITPVADLELVSSLVRGSATLAPEVPASNIQVQYARELSYSDVHDSNLVLIGTTSFNPWISLYEGSLDFRIHRDFSDFGFTVENKAPLPGEHSSYTWNAATSIKDAITLLALTDNSQGSGKVLLVQGTTMSSTFGAVNFLSDEKLWEPILSQAEDPKVPGRLRNFEVLLMSDLVRGGVTNTKVVAVHIHR